MSTKRTFTEKNALRENICYSDLFSTPEWKKRVKMGSDLTHPEAEGKKKIERSLLVSFLLAYLSPLLSLVLHEQLITVEDFMGLTNAVIDMSASSALDLYAYITKRRDAGYTKDNICDILEDMGVDMCFLDIFEKIHDTRVCCACDSSSSSSSCSSDEDAGDEEVEKGKTGKVSTEKILGEMCKTITILEGHNLPDRLSELEDEVAELRLLVKTRLPGSEPVSPSYGYTSPSWDPSEHFKRQCAKELAESGSGSGSSDSTAKTTERDHKKAKTRK